MNTIDLNRSFGFLVHDVARLLGKRFDQRARGIGLTRAQCKVLGYLARNEGINQAGLADLLEIEPITLVRLLDRMEDAGWIERRLDPEDRRARRLFLAERARPIFAELRRLSDETRREAMAGLPALRQEQLIDLLLHVHGNLSGKETPAAPFRPRGEAAEQLPERRAANARAAASSSRRRPR